MEFILPPVFLPVFLFVGIAVLWILMSIIQRLMPIVLVASSTVGMAIIMETYYLPQLGAESLGMWVLYPPVYWDKVIGFLATTSAEPSLLYTAIMCLGILYCYFAWSLRKATGMASPFFAGAILLIFGMSLPGFRSLLNVWNIELLFYGMIVLLALGMIGWKMLSKKK